VSLPIISELRALGVEVIPDGDALIIRPASKVPFELKERLRVAKAEVLAALKARPATPFKAGKRIGCRYDWVDGYRGLRLHCVAHNHAAQTTTVLVMRWAGRDTLQDMAESGILSGEALKDSQRVN
jgi:hypothetical protein